MERRSDIGKDGCAKCVPENLNSAILVMKAAENRAGMLWCQWSEPPGVSPAQSAILECPWPIAGA